jgi:phage FluMu protein Com
MPIEFRCTRCHKLLQTPDNTAGKHAKCPVCETLIVIPAAGSAAAVPPADASGGGLPPSPPRGDASPFVAGPLPTPRPDAVNPYQSPTAYSPVLWTPAPGTSEITPARIHFGDVFDRTWTIFKKQGLMAFVGLLIWMAVGFVGSMVLFHGLALVGMAVGGEPLMIVGFITGYVLSILYGTYLLAGVLGFFLQLVRGQEASIGELFRGGERFLSVLGINFIFILCLIPPYVICLAIPLLQGMGRQDPGVWLLFILLGYVIFIVVWIFLCSFFVPAFFLAVDRRLGPLQALREGLRVSQGNRLIFFLICLVMGALYLAACLPCGLGLLVWFPFFAIQMTVVYLAMTGQRTMEQIYA